MQKQIAIDYAVDFAVNDDHGYTQSNHQRWGTDGDCSTVVIRAWEAADVHVKSFGATYTGNMKAAFLKAGFTDVTHLINLATGAGLEPADVLLRTTGHTALFIGNYAGRANQIVQSLSNEKGGKTGGQPGDQTGKEIYIRGYYNSPWNVVLRYGKEETMNCPYQEPTMVYASGVQFSGIGALWFIWHLRQLGYELVDGSNVAGPKTWAAIWSEQEKAGLGRGDAGPKTREWLKAQIAKSFANTEVDDLKATIDDLKTQNSILRQKIEAAKAILEKTI